MDTYKIYEVKLTFFDNVENFEIIKVTARSSQEAEDKARLSYHPAVGIPKLLSVMS